MSLVTTGLPRYIGDRKRILGNYGFFVKEGNPDSMAKGILKALKNPEFEGKRDLVIKRASAYSWDKLTDKMELIIKELLVK